MEKTKISFYGIDFVVIENKGVVLCKLQYKVNVPEVVRLLAKTMTDDKDVKKLLSDNDTFECFGVAKLMDGDTFDVEVGKKIARAKAESVAYANVANVIIKVYSKFGDALNSMEDFFDKASRVLVHNEEYVGTF